MQIAPILCRAGIEYQNSYRRFSINITASPFFIPIDTNYFLLKVKFFFEKVEKILMSHMGH